MKAVNYCKRIRKLRILERRMTSKLFKKKSIRRENAAWVPKNTQEGSTINMSEIFSKRKLRQNKSNEPKLTMIPKISKLNRKLETF
jgi:hypothetical protein